MKKTMKIGNRYLWGAMAAGLLLLAGCHNDSFSAGFGQGVGVLDPNKPYPGEIPFLTSLTLAEQRNPQVRLDLSPGFSSAETAYQVDTGSLKQTEVYTVKAESKFDIVYTTGDTFDPGTTTFIIVSAFNGPLKTDYMVTFFSPNLEYAELESLDFSAGSFDPPLEFNNKSTPTVKRKIYTLKVPQGTKQVVAAGVAEIRSARIFYSAIPLDLAAKKEMVIQVAAPGYNVGVYKVNVTEADPLPSFLDDVEFSTGSLAPSFSRDIKDYTLTLHSGEQLTVLGHVVRGTVTYSQGSVLALNARYIAAPQQGSTLVLTAHYGEGYVDADYRFTLAIDPREYAFLTAIQADTQDYTLYKRNGGARATEGFESNVINYEMYFNGQLPSAYTITGTAESGGTATYTKLNEYTWIITAQQSGKLPLAYHVFINYDDAYKPYATLSDLTLTGGSLSPVFGEAVYEYTGQVIEGGNAVLRASPKEEFFAVRYDAANSVTNLLAPVKVVITVEGGIAYRPAVYTVSFEPLALQKPYLKDISLDGSVLFSIAQDEVERLYYEYRVPWDYAGGDTPELSWNVAFPNDVAQSEYKLITSNNWNTGYSYNLTLEAGTSIMVQVRIKCHDGGQAVYNILLSREGELNTELYMYDITITTSGSGEVVSMGDILERPLSSRVFIWYIGDSNVRTVQGIAVDSDVTVSYSENATGEYSLTPPKISLQIGDKSTVYIKLQRDKAYNLYQMVLSRITTRFKIDPVTITQEGWGDVDIQPARALADGILAGELVRIELKPKRNQGPSANIDYKIAAKPVVTRMPGETKLDELPGSVPYNSDAQFYHFLMPDSNVRIEAVFEDILSKNNELIDVQIQNADGTVPVYDNATASVKKKIKVFFDQQASQIEVAMFERSAIDIKFTVPEGASLYLDTVKPANKLALTKEGGVYTAVKNFSISANKKDTYILWVVPDNPAIKSKPYGLSIRRFIQAKWVFGYRNSAHSLALPVEGKYQFQIGGAAGATSKTSTSGPAGGEGGGAKGLAFKALFAFDANKTLELYVGQGAPTMSLGQTGRGDAGWGGKADEFNGTRGGSGSSTTTAGGGGGGAATVYIGNEYIMVAGGGGGGKTRSSDQNGIYDDKNFSESTAYYSTPESGTQNDDSGTGGHGGGYMREGEKDKGNRGKYGRSYVKKSGAGYRYLGTLAELNANKMVGGTKSKSERETVIDGSITVEWMGAE